MLQMVCVAFFIFSLASVLLISSLFPLSPRETSRPAVITRIIGWNEIVQETASVFCNRLRIDSFNGEVYNLRIGLILFMPTVSDSQRISHRIHNPIPVYQKARSSSRRS